MKIKNVKIEDYTLKDKIEEILEEMLDSADFKKGYWIARDRLTKLMEMCE